MEVLSELKLLEDSEVNFLQNDLEKKGQKSAYVMNMIQTYVKITKFRKIYTDKFKPSTFVVSPSPDFKRLFVFWDDEKISSEKVVEKLFLLFEHTWKESKNMVIAPLEINLANLLERCVNENPSWNVKFREIVTIYMLRLIPEKLPELRLHNDFVLGSLKPEHAELVLESMNDRDYDIPAVQLMLTRLPSTAIYRKCAKDTDEPVAWALLYHTGSIRFVYTKEGYRRKGLAASAINSLCRKLLKIDNFVVMSGTEIDNFASIAMHKKLGFETINMSKVFSLEK